ncbi:MAG: hypothetical protein JW843_08945 [Candidatus Aminicenantes bacterium]|nr:hypothetical protein [Candidatus Aminicenantes bacterium]
MRVWSLLAAALLVFGSPAGQQPGEGPLSAAECDLAALINAARVEAGLPAVPVTVSLTKTARLHVADLNANRPDTGADARSQACNLHSWSANGAWTPVCYTADHHYSSLMWNKPREITGVYDDNGYEIAHGGGMPVTPSGAMNGWLSSPAHLDVIMERSIWEGCFWKSLGVAVEGQYAVAWFGEDPDPAGDVPAAKAPPSSPAPKDRPKDEAVFGGLILRLKKTQFGPGEDVQFEVSKTTPGPADLTNSHFRIDIKTDDGWEAYYRSGRITYRQGPLLESEEGRSFKWNRLHQHRDHEARPGKTYRVKFYAPRTTREVLHARFMLVE